MRPFSAKVVVYDHGTDVEVVLDPYIFEESFSVLSRPHVCLVHFKTFSAMPERSASISAHFADFS